MKVIDPDTGEEVILFPTDALNRDLSAFEEAYCTHPKLEIRESIIANGAIQFRNQCLDCGELVGTAIAKSRAPLNVPRTDDVLFARYKKAREDERKRIIVHHLRKQKGNDEEWRRKYDKYLESPEWGRRRKLVLKRAGGICEGCGERPATEVHHLTYSHAFGEFLFELVAVCDVCHQRIHQDEAQDGLENEWSESFPCGACRWQAPDGDCGPERRELEPLR
jgi:hypothetical protein